MTGQKNKIHYVIMFIITMFVVIQLPLQVSAQNTQVKATEADTRIIPDKYNTGCTGALTKVSFGTADRIYVNDILVIAGSGHTGTRFVLDFYYRNKDISGTVYIENYDFTENSLWSYNEDKVDRKVKIVFNNCKFTSVSVGRTQGNISFEFNNCSMNSFSGSNSTFNRCQFGNSYSDGLVPFCNIQVNDCLFKDMASVPAEGGVHTDGTQIYGVAGTDVQNVSYNNCRFSIPPLKRDDSNAYINACIMLQLEFSNAKNLTFTDCIVNGGGFSIYARGKDDSFTFDNVSFNGIRFGAANKYGIFYTDINKNIKITDVSETDSLYIGSVWKENGQTHFSVTNDTSRERTLLIYTDKGTYNYTIPACTTGLELTSAMMYEDMPFDMDIVVPVNCNYAVCFDSTMSGYGKQIRFVNWSGTQVYLPSNIANSMTVGANEVLISGKCGNDVTFTLTKSGILTLTGTGSTYNYHSQKFPEWVEYKDYIKEIRVEEGIEGLGSMIFRKCTSVEKLSLPDSLTVIGQYVFGGCVSIDEVTLPAGITKLGNSVFSGTVLQEIYYEGNNWDAVTLGTGNENLVERIVVGVKVDETTKNDNKETNTSENSTTTAAPIENGGSYENETKNYLIEDGTSESGDTKKSQSQTGDSEMQESETTKSETSESEMEEKESFADEIDDTNNSDMEDDTTKSVDTEDDAERNASSKKEKTDDEADNKWLIAGILVLVVVLAGGVILGVKKIKKSE